MKEIANQIKRTISLPLFRDQTRPFSTSNDKREKKAVVSGKSVSGMIAGLILAKNGYKVDIYDVRDAYKRNIQWAGRQSLIDQLFWLDKMLCQKFVSEVAQFLEKGSVHIAINADRKVSKRQEIKAPDPSRIPRKAEEMIAEKSIITMEAKRFEKILKSFLDPEQNIKQHRALLNC